MKSDAVQKFKARSVRAAVASVLTLCVVAWFCVEAHETPLVMVLGLAMLVLGRAAITLGPSTADIREATRELKAATAGLREDLRYWSEFMERVGMGARVDPDSETLS